jgi:hypothetical protein
METIFQIINTIALIGWIFLIFFPTNRWTFGVVASGGITAILAIFYIYFLASAMTGESTGGDFSSLEGVKLLFQTDFGVLTGWAHYLAFDLFIGAFITSNAQKLGLTHWKIVPCLLFTFMLGPIGLLTYFILRAVMTKKVLHEQF